MDVLTDENLITILSDNKSGSTQLILQLNRWIRSNIDKLENFDLLERRIRSSLGHFQTIDDYINKLIDLYKLNDKIELSIFFDKTELEIHSDHKKIFENGRSYFSKVKTIITISNSFSVSQFIINLHSLGQLNEVIVCESRPVMEGRVLAEKLLDHGINVRLITDAAVSYYMEDVDTAIIGADKILADGSVINKIGSKQLAIVCKHFKTPLYVVADKTKYSKSNKFDAEKYPQNEIWDYKHKNLIIDNIYFECIEKTMITKIIGS